jgi:dipeptidyl aminopeptidase/acylaminoacyl peptidase
MRYLLCAAIVALLPCVADAQDRVVPVPERVKAEGLPPIPQSIADDLSKYANFREAQFLAWHPSKQQILIQTAFGSAPQVHLVDGPGRARTQLTFFPDGISRQFAWAQFDPADGATIVLRKDTSGGKETNQLFRYSVATGDMTLITDGQSRYGPPAWSRQGKWIAYDSTERNGRDHDLYVMQPADPRSARRVAELQGTWQVLDWSPDGASLLALEQVGDAETYLWRVDVKSGERKALTPRTQGAAAWGESARFSADGRSVYAVSDKGSDRNRLWRGDVATGTWTALTAETEGVDPTAAFDLSSDGQMVAIVFDRGSRSELQVLDLGTMKPRPLSGIPVGVITRVAWRPNSRQVAFTFANVKTFGDVYSVDASLGTLTRWTTSEVGGFNPDVLPAPEVVEWKSVDGLPISGVLYKPPSRFTGPRPVMINIHGGPNLRSLPVFIGRSNYLLNDLGIAIIYPNVRGSAGFGRKFEQADNGLARVGAIKDIGALLDWIATRPEFDRDRVMLTGASYGGYLTLQAAIEYNDRIRCAYEAAGMTNLVAFLEETDPSRQAERRPEYGDERDPQMRAFLSSISPITRAAELKKPVVVIHPSKDTRIPVGQAADFAKAVRANGTPVWYIEYTDLGHDNFPGTRAYNDFNFACWVLFVKTYLLNP